MTRFPTIMQVIPRLDAGGAEQTTLEINQALLAAGWRSVVVSAGGRYARAIEAAGGVHITLPVDSKNPFLIWANTKKLARVAQEHEVSLIHARSRAPAWSALWASRTLNIPLVTTYHGAYKAGSSLKRWYNSSMVRGTRVIANSMFTHNTILEVYASVFPDLHTRLRVIPRGADLIRFDPDIISQERINILTAHWPETGIEAGDRAFRFLLPARMSIWKGHEVAINAVKTLVRTGHTTNLRLIFCGGHQSAQGSSNAMVADGVAVDDGRVEQNLRDLVVKNGVGDLVHFAGYCEDMPAAYAAADAVLVPSTRPEAFGRVAVEAGAMGVPVIASDHGGTAETVRDGETGFLVPAGDENVLADAMKALMAMPLAARHAVGKAAQHHVAEVYSIDAMTKSTLDLYGDVLGIQADGGAADV